MAKLIPGPVDEDPPGRDIADVPTLRQRIYDDVFNTVKQLPPTSAGGFTLRLAEPTWADPPDFSPTQQKKAVLEGATLGRRLRGTWELVNDQSGQVVDRRTQVVARVPYLTPRGVFLHRGSHYTVGNQQRLLPGVYTRRKSNDEVEAHVNALPGRGLTHHYGLDPAKGVFKVRIGQGEMPLAPLLRVLGTTDDELKDAWGPELAAANQASPADAVTIKKLRQAFLRRSDGDDQALAAAVRATALDPRVTAHTLGAAVDHLDKDVILAATKKVLALARGEAEPDDRDDPAYQRLLGPEDFFVERLKNDDQGIRQQALRDALKSGNLAKLPSGLLTPQLESAILRSGLGQAVEESNPLEILDRLTRTTRMGIGGIPSTDSIPDESRNLRPSQFNFFDPVRTVESERVGVDLFLGRQVRKGEDGQLYAPFRTPSGQRVWRSPDQLRGQTVGMLANPKRWPYERQPILRDGKIDYAAADEVDLYPEAFEHSFSPLGALVPAKSTMKNQRLSMGARMLTQALPLAGGEAPLVRTGVPGSGGQRAFEEEYGATAGAIASPSGGTVVTATPDLIVVRDDNGQETRHELYNEYPMNRKTLLSQTPLVKTGERIRPGQLLAKSNYTDDRGAIAVGVNARVGFLGFQGRNFEDAIVVSESFAKNKLRSEHAYQFDLPTAPGLRTGKRDYIGLFPGKFDRDQLDTLDDNGVIRPGTPVTSGAPLILGAKQRQDGGRRIHRRGQPGYSDATVTWDHEDDGIVTDVARGPDGPRVVVKAYSPAKPGDKLSGRHGNKGVIDVVPDEQMPRDANGEPLEVLLGPEGVISRGNPAQTLELALGKIAARRGRPYRLEDFEDIEDLRDWTEQELRRNNVTLEEDVTDPETGQVIPGVPVGRMWLMKLHHQAEAKEQGRGGGGYSQDDRPSKGGPAGCLLGSTPVLTARGLRHLRVVSDLHRELPQRVTTRHPDGTIALADVTESFQYLVPPERLCCITLEDGRALVLTDDHEVYLADGTKKPARDLVAGAQLDEDPEWAIPLTMPTQ